MEIIKPVIIMIFVSYIACDNIISQESMDGKQKVHLSGLQYDSGDFLIERAWSRQNGEWYNLNYFQEISVSIEDEGKLTIKGQDFLYDLRQGKNYGETELDSAKLLNSKYVKIDSMVDNMQLILYTGQLYFGSRLQFYVTIGYVIKDGKLKGLKIFRESPSMEYMFSFTQ